MDKEQLIKDIDGAIENVKFIAKIASESITKEELLPIIANICSWLIEIKGDLKEELVPQTYFDVISGWIVPFNFNNDMIQKEKLKKFVEDGIVGELVVNNGNVCSFLNAVLDISSYHFYKQLNFAQSNTVIVGANGSGKTSLANTLSKTLHIENGIVIPAQKILIIPTFSSIPNYDSSIKAYQGYQHKIMDDRQTYDVMKEDDFPYRLTKDYGIEFRYVLATLIAEQVKLNNAYGRKVKKNEEVNRDELNSTLDKVIDIWNKLIKHRTLDVDDNNNLIVKVEGGTSYEAYKMSDGERVILYFAGRVLLAPKNSLIIVDEPEGYLHESIINKLWDELEEERQDCVFIYLTHDLKFAASRRCKKFWMKSFIYPDSWKIEPIPQNDIPEELMMEVLGSRNKILFCEGTKNNSLDVKIYEAIFPDYTIIPVESCKAVIAYTRAYNKIPNKNSEAYGIVDRDFREDAQIEKFKKENIFTTDVAEIENFFLYEPFLRLFIEYKREHAEAINKIKSDTLNLLKTQIEQQTSWFISAKINYYYSEADMSKGNDEEEIEKNFTAFNSRIDIKGWFAERKKKIEDIIAKNDYDTAIRIFNNKGLQYIVESDLGIGKGQFRLKALDFLVNNREAKHALRSLFPEL